MRGGPRRFGAVARMRGPLGRRPGGVSLAPGGPAVSGRPEGGPRRPPSTPPALPDRLKGRKEEGGARRVGRWPCAGWRCRARRCFRLASPRAARLSRGGRPARAPPGGLAGTACYTAPSDTTRSGKRPGRGLLAVAGGGEAVEVDLGLAAEDGVGDGAAGAAGHGPAECAVPGVEEKVRSSGSGRSPGCRRGSSGAGRSSPRPGRRRRPSGRGRRRRSGRCRWRCGRGCGCSR